MAPIIEERVYNLVRYIVPRYRGTTVEELLGWDEDSEVTENVQNDDMVNAIVNLDAETAADSTAEHVVSDPTTQLGSAQLQLEAMQGSNVF